MSSLLLLPLLLLVLTAPRTVYGYHCAELTTGEQAIIDSVATMTSSCSFTATEDKKYVKLDVEKMVQSALTTGAQKVPVKIDGTTFTNIGLHIAGYTTADAVPSTTVPLEITVTNSIISNEKGYALYLEGALPPRSTMTWRNGVLSTRGHYAIAASSLALRDQTQILLDKNRITATALYNNEDHSNSRPTVGTVLHTTNMTMKGKSSLSFVSNTLVATTDACSYCDVAIWYQPEETTMVMADDSTVLWKGNEMNATAPRLARIWYQDKTNLTVKNSSNITWMKNTMRSVSTNNHYPYIWHSYSIAVAEQSVIEFVQNDASIKADSYGRIWYQRAVLRVEGDGSVVAWRGNQVTTVCAGGANWWQQGDSSIWFQGSPGEGEFTHTSITNKGLVAWSHNNITMEYASYLYLWRHHASEKSKTVLSEEGTILWEHNNITSRGNTHDWRLWLQTSKIIYSISQRGALLWRHNTMHIVNERDNGWSSCISCLTPESFTIESNGILAFERNTVNINSKNDNKKKIFFLKGPIQLNQANVMMKRNEISLVEGLTLVRMYDAAGQSKPVVEDANIYMCQNTLNTVEIEDYTSRLVMPPSLKPYVQYVCPSTRTATMNATPTLTATHTAPLPRTTTATHHTTATPTATIKPTQTLTMPPTTTTTTSTSTTTANDSLDARNLGDNNNDESDGVCYLCIILPIVIILLLLCCIILLVFFCLRRRREHKQLDDVVAIDSIYPPATNDEANHASAEWRDVVRN